MQNIKKATEQEYRVTWDIKENQDWRFERDVNSNVWQKKAMNLKRVGSFDEIMRSWTTKNIIKSTKSKYLEHTSNLSGALVG